MKYGLRFLDQWDSIEGILESIDKGQLGNAIKYDTAIVRAIFLSFKLREEEAKEVLAERKKVQTT